MKKTLLSLIIASSVALTACDDKQVQNLNEQLNQKEQTISQLNSNIATLNGEIEKLKGELKTEQDKASQILPGITTQEEVLFSKKDKVKLTNKEELAEIEKEYQGSTKAELEELSTTAIEYHISSLKTNIQWLDDLLLTQVLNNFSNNENKVTSKAQLVKNLENDYQETVKEAKNTRSNSIEYDTELNFIGQKENLATFTLYNYEYTGGAHGIFHTDYINIDLAKKSVITLNDLFTEKNQQKVRELLWNIYKIESHDENGKEMEPFTAKTEFNVPDNFYFSLNGIHFVYSVYEIGPYVEGEKELSLSWQELNPLLNKPFQKEIKERELQ